MTRDTKGQLLILVALGALLIAIPFVAPNTYYVDLAAKSCIAAVVCVGLNLLVGYAGQISLGHAAFFGIGAYASAILGTKYDITPILAMLAGVTLTVVVAYVTARAVLHLKGHYLAMATLAVGVAVSIILTREIALTGGPDGMSVRRFSIFGYPLTGIWATYGISAITLFIAVRTAIVLANSRVGRALRAIRDSETAAQNAGIDVARYKTIVFVISAVYASVAGSVFAHVDRFITPGAAGFMHSVEYLAMIVIGGLGSVAGAIVGATLMTVLPQALATFDHFRHLLTGAALILIMTLMPAGIVPTLVRSWPHLVRRLSGRDASSLTSTSAPPGP
jgi:branched-chain amino acid transport system permease protein